MKFFTCIGITFLSHLFVVFILGFSFKKGLSQDIILKASVQVNLVALPEKKLSSSIRTKPKKIVLLSKKKAKKQNPKNKQKDILKKIKERLRKQKQKNVLKKIKDKGVKDKNNSVKAGNKLSSELQNQIQNYLEELKLHVHSFWSIPQWIDQSSLKVEIIVYLNKNGDLLRSKYFSKSANEDFNLQAFNALNLASPYPPPPKELVDLLKSSGIIFSFP